MTVWMVNKPSRFREIVKIKDNQIFCNGEDDRLSLVSAYVYNKDANFINPETKKPVPFEEVIKAAKPGMSIVPCNHFCNKLKLIKQMAKWCEAEYIQPELKMCYDGANKCGLDKFGLVYKAR